MLQREKKIDKNECQKNATKKMGIIVLASFYMNVN